MRRKALNTYPLAMGMAIGLCLVAGSFSQAQESLLGDWLLLFNDDGEIDSIKLEFRLEEGVVGGICTSELGELPMMDVVFSDGTLTFNVDAGNRSIKVEFEGTVDGDHLDGVLRTNFGKSFVCEGGRIPGPVRIAIQAVPPDASGDNASGTDILVVVWNLAPNAYVKILAEKVDSEGMLWRSRGQLRASDAGVVKLTARAASEGTSTDGDDWGLFSSMTNTLYQPVDWPESSADEEPIRVQVVAKEEVVASIWYMRKVTVSGVEVE